jgi:cytochrome bd-type quinol oxidase subunit 2
MRISGPILALLALVLLAGSMLTLSFYLNADAGDSAAQNRIRLSAIVTLLLSVFVLLAGTGRWWHPHLWRHGNSQKQHRHRRGGPHSQRQR